jgi:hypothetical protein
MSKITNIFIGGLSRDLAPTEQDNKHLYYAENFRITTQKGLSSAILENEEGNRLLLSFPASYTYCGHTYIRQDLILFASNAPLGAIFRITGTQLKAAIEAGTTITINMAYYHTDPAFSGDRQLITRHLVFQSDEFPIDGSLVAFGRHEDPDIEKVYFTDSNHTLRYINLIYNSQYNDLTISTLNLTTIQNVSINPPSVSVQTGGKLTTGKVQYAVQFYSLYGAESFFSPVSIPVLISTSPNIATYVSEIKGDNEGKIVNKSVLVTFSLNAGVSRNITDFQRVRLIAIDYINGDLAPTIRIAYDSFVTPTTTSILDTGENLGTYSLEEFRGLSNFLFTPKLLESKDEMMFAANIKETYFDTSSFDTRAYRFNSGGQSVVYDLNNSYYTIQTNGNWSHSSGVGTGTNWTIPTTADCINRYNRYNDDIGFINLYMFQASNLTKLGAEGPNIKLEVISTSVNIDGASVDQHNVSAGGALVTPLSAARAYYLSGEIYRIGIVFRDQYGRRSLPSWVCDLRISNHFESTEDICTAAGVDYKCYYIEATVKAMPVGAVSWELIRSPRKESDKTILGYGVLARANTVNKDGNTWQGFVDQPMIEDPGSGGVYNVPFVMDRRLYKFISPDFLIGKLTIENTYTFRSIGYVSSRDISTGNFPTMGYPNNGGNPQSFATKIKYQQIKHYTANAVDTLTILDSRQVFEEPYGVKNGAILSFETDEIRNNTYYWAASTMNEGQGGEGLILKFSGAVPLYNRSNFDLIYGFILRDNYSSMYGGYTYNARINSEYIGCGVESIVLNTPVNIYGGDTYPGMFCYVLSHAVTKAENGVDGGKLFSTVTFPVECSYNLDYRTDENPINEADNRAHCLVRSIAGSYVADDGTTRFNQAHNLYNYNRAYSRDLDAEKFIPLENLKITTNFDCRVYGSNVKTNGELVDNWLKYKVNQYIDVDTRYGPITALINYNNKILFFQERAFGLLSINEQALLQTNTTSKLVIGEGGVLDRYNYISTESGVMDRKEIIITKYGIFWTDRINSSLCYYTGGDSSMTLKDLKLEKGMNSWVSENVKYTSPVYVGFNDYTKDVSFSFPSLSKTLIYNVETNTFNDFQTYSTNNYIPTGKHLLSVNPVAGNLWVQGMGGRGSYYGTTSASKIQFIVNPNSPYSCVFDNLEWFSEYNFDKIQVSNGYQYSPLLDVTAVHRLRTWFTQVPRATNYINGAFLERQDARMRDYYMLVELHYLNVGGSKFNVGSIISDVTLSNIKSD